MELHATLLGKHARHGPHLRQLGYGISDGVRDDSATTKETTRDREAHARHNASHRGGRKLARRTAARLSNSHHRRHRAHFAFIEHHGTSMAFSFATCIALIRGRHIDKVMCGKRRTNLTVGIRIKQLVEPRLPHWRQHASNEQGRESSRESKRDLVPGYTQTIVGITLSSSAVGLQNLVRLKHLRQQDTHDSQASTNDESGLSMQGIVVNERHLDNRSDQTERPDEEGFICRHDPRSTPTIEGRKGLSTPNTVIHESQRAGNNRQ